MGKASLLGGGSSAGGSTGPFSYDASSLGGIFWYAMDAGRLQIGFILDTYI